MCDVWEDGCDVWEAGCVMCGRLGVCGRIGV